MPADRRCAPCVGISPKYAEICSGIFLKLRVGGGLKSPQPSPLINTHLHGNNVLKCWEIKLGGGVRLAAVPDCYGDDKRARHAVQAKKRKKNKSMDENNSPCAASRRGRSRGPLKRSRASAAYAHTRTDTHARVCTNGQKGWEGEWRSAGVFDYGTLTSRRARMTLGRDGTDGPPSSPQGLVLSRYFRHSSYFIFLRVRVQTDTPTLERNVRKKKNKK